MVSIITPCYNSAAFIEQTYQSIAAQTYTDWEWIVVDDGSTDKSMEIVNKLARSDDRIKVFKNTNQKGPGNTRNVGIKNARGKYMTFLDSDDYWYPSFIETSIDTMEREGVHFVFASYERWNDDLKYMYNAFIVPQTLTYNQLLYTCPISCLTAFINIESLGKKYMSNMAKRQDYGLWLDYLKEIDYAYGIERPLAKYRIRKDSVSAKKSSLVKHQFNVYFKHQKIGLLRSLFYTLTWAYYGFMKYRKVKD